MDKPLRTYSENWHRIANARVALSPNIRTQRQQLRGEEWIILEDPLNNRFFRLPPEAYQFVARLNPEQTVEQVWKRATELSPESAPGQEEVIQILSQLHHANLLYGHNPMNSSGLFIRHQKQRKKELKAKIAGIMFARIPLFDPTPILAPLLTLLRPFRGWFGMLLWLVVVLLGTKQVVEHADILLDQTESVISPNNLILLYAATVLIKILHEFGHALVCRYYGGEVHTMGVMLIVFTPLPYMDATSSWRFRSRWQRIAVSAAGMGVELFIAAVAAIVWANSGTGLVHSLAYNMMFVASVSTLLFNINPLLRFDGYYMLADLTGIANLYQRARQQWRYIFEKFFFRLAKVETVTDNRREAVWLTSYGLLSSIYRLFVFFGILLFVGDQYLILGVLMAFIMIVMWVLLPPYKLIKYLISNPRLDRKRGMVTLQVALSLGAIVAVLILLPAPDRFRAQGVVQGANAIMVNTHSDGYLQELLAKPGSWVEQGQPLLHLSNSGLDQKIAANSARQQQVKSEIRKAQAEAAADLAPLHAQQQGIVQQHSYLLKQQSLLTVLARRDGYWIAPELMQRTGSWIPRGTAVGKLISSQQHRFTAVITQDEATVLFSEPLQEISIRLLGNVQHSLSLEEIEIIPAAQSQLPSAALGWLGGGESEVNIEDRSGLNTTEPYFRVGGILKPHPEVSLLHGRTGFIRFSLSEKPLAKQWHRDLRQVLQRRYQL